MDASDDGEPLTRDTRMSHRTRDDAAVSTPSSASPAARVSTRQAGHDWPAAVAGVVATATALGVSELLAGLLPGATSLVAAVGQVVIDLQPPGAKDVVVGLFGTNDKLALEVLIVAVALLIGAGLGLLGAPPLRDRGRRLRRLRRRRLRGLARRSAGVPDDRRASRRPSRSASGLLGPRLAARPLARRRPRRRRTDATRRPPTMPDWSRRAFLIRAGARRRRRGRRRGRRPATCSSASGPRRSAPGPPIPPASVTVPPLDARRRTCRTTVAGLTPIVMPNDRFYRIDTALLTPSGRHDRLDAADPRPGRPRDDPDLGRSSSRCRCSSST